MTSLPSMSNSHLPLSSGVAGRGSAQSSTTQPPDPAVRDRWSSGVSDPAGGDDGETGRPAKRQKVEQAEEDADAAPHGSEPAESETSAVVAPIVVNAVSRSEWDRPPWSFGDEVPHARREGGVPARSVEEGGQTQPAAPLPPFPVRPWTYGPPTDSASLGPVEERDPGATEVQIAPYDIETPKVAPVYDQDKVADFYPWRGTHPEDELTEQTAKHGYFDHVQVSQNESNTARPSLYAQFKHRSGLKVLSSVLSAALEKRQTNARVPDASTFKPPPRVTLTDMKREAWLRDLANPSVPLRKLSRTIPHGIRGKSLLDQCLSKSIPLGRALWLAKCVGANEIRAFKRKGTNPAVASGLESKWVRDWTVNVIQFLEGVIGGCGVEGWRDHLNYAVRFSSRLFLDNLLDQDHFLEWILSSLDCAPLDTLPVWLLMTRLYSKNLVRYRKRGRRLAECLLEKLCKVTDTDNSESLLPLRERLCDLIKGLVLSHPSCFILPGKWSQYESYLASCLDMTQTNTKGFFTQLSIRNAQICKVKGTLKDNSRFPSRKLITLLDSSVTNYRPSLSSECLNLQLDPGTLVSTLLQWASTSFRNGLARVYIAVKLLRKWNRSGMDTDTHILTFLANHRYHDVVFTYIYHIISELVRSRSFSVGRYLQWLMARGVVGQPDNPGHLPRDVELLSQIPSRHLPSHVWNLRNTLLERTGYSVTAERQLSDQVHCYLQRHLPNIFGAPPASPAGDVEMTRDTEFGSLSWTLRSEISQYLRERVASHLKTHSENGNDSNTATRNHASTLTPEEFCQIRHVLEGVEDISMLAGVLGHVSRVDDISVLVAALDTIYYHFNSFAAMGATGDLFKRYFTAYTRVARSGTPTVELTSSLVEFGIKVPVEISTISMLRRDLARLDRRGAVAASSPVSDIVTDTLNPVAPSFPESLEQLLGSGNSMDEPATIRIFEILVQMLASGKADAKLSLNGTAGYLARLRNFNTKLFDTQMLKWVISTIISPSRPSLATFLPPLIGVGCITFHAFFRLIQKLLSSARKEDSVSDPVGLRLDMLRLLNTEAPSDFPFLDLVSYRYRTAREEYIYRHPESVLGLLNDILNTSQTSSGDQDGESGKSITDGIVPLMDELIVKSSGHSERDPADWVLRDFPACKQVLDQTVTRLLGSQAHNCNGVAAARETLHLINDFSLPCCLVKFQLLWEAESDSEAKQGILDMVLQAAESDIRLGETRWVDVMGVLHLEAAQQVRQRAEQALLALVLSNSSQHQSSPPSTQTPSNGSKQTDLAYLLVIEELSWTIAPDEAQSFGTVLVEKLNQLLQTFAAVRKSAGTGNSNGNEAGHGTDEASQGTRLPLESTLFFWFYVLLRLVALHRSTLPSSSASTADISDQTRLVLILCCIALLPQLSERPEELCHGLSHFSAPSSDLRQNYPATRRNIRTYALDITLSLVDTLPDEARQTISRFLRDRGSPDLQPKNNPFLLHLLGPLAEPQTLQLQLPQSGGGAPSQSTLTTNPPPPHQQQAQAQAQSQRPVSPSAGPAPLTPVEDPTSLTHKLQFQQGGRVMGSCPSRPWEMLEESAPILGVNDTALNLAYFGTRQFRA